MANHQYDAYLQSPEWKATRAKAIARASRRCERCGIRKHLQVHHRTYSRIFDEGACDLEVLCYWCHKDEHGHPYELSEPSGRFVNVVARTKLEKRKQKSETRVVEFADRRLRVPGKCWHTTCKGRPCPIPADRIDSHGRPVCHVHDPQGNNMRKCRTRKRRRTKKKETP